MAQRALKKDFDTVMYPSYDNSLFEAGARRSCHHARRYIVAVVPSGKHFTAMSATMRFPDWLAMVYLSKGP